MAAFHPSKSKVKPIAPPGMVKAACVVIAAIAVSSVIAGGWKQAGHVAFDGDSFGFVDPGLLMATGARWRGSGFRDIGYPAFTALAVALGGFSVIPKLQLAAAGATVGVTCATIYLYLRLQFARISHTGRLAGLGLLAGFSALGFAYTLLLLSNDQYADFISGVRPEAVLALMASVAALAFVGGVSARSASVRIVLFALAASAGYAATLMKPSAGLVFALCAAALAVTTVHAWRTVSRSPVVLIVCMLCVAGVGVGYGLNRELLKPDYDFGPRTMFCNHLPVVLPSVGSATPERARLSALLANTVRAGPGGWITLGYNGDICMNDRAIYDATEAARRRDAMSAPAWLSRQVRIGITAHPLAYAREVLAQLRLFFVRPFPDIDMGPFQGNMGDEDWRRLQPFQRQIGLSRRALSPVLTNEFSASGPRLIALGKAAFHALSRLFAACVAVATVVALAVSASARDRSRLGPERVVLAMGGITLAFVLPTAIAHTFDISRYAVGIMPVSLAWLLVCIAYLVSSAALLLSGRSGDGEPARTRSSTSLPSPTRPQS